MLFGSARQGYGRIDVGARTSRGGRRRFTARSERIFTVAVFSMRTMKRVGALIAASLV